MSYDIRIKKNRKTVILPDLMKEAWTTVTFNFSDLFAFAFKNKEGIKVLHKMTVEKAVPLLKEAINNLSDDNSGPTLEELRNETEEYRQKVQQFEKLLKSGHGRGLHILLEISQSYLDHLEKRLYIAQYMTGGKVVVSSWDPTPYNAKKSLKRVLALAEQCPPNARIYVEC